MNRRRRPDYDQERSPNGEFDPDVTIERRQTRGRREEDQIPKVPSEGVAVWSMQKLVRSLILVMTSAAATLGFAATIGLRWGPREDISALQASTKHQQEEIDSMSQQIRLLHSADSAFGVQTAAVIEGQKFQQYIQCTFIRRFDPASLPVECGQVITEYRNKSR